MKLSEGDRVIIRDGSEAHGDAGEIFHVGKDGLILVELDGYDCLWPVSASDLEKGGGK
jgi:hypothetical protein